MLLVLFRLQMAEKNTQINKHIKQRVYEFYYYCTRYIKMYCILYMRYFSPFLCLKCDEHKSYRENIILLPILMSEFDKIFFYSIQKRHLFHFYKKKLF